MEDGRRKGLGRGLSALIGDDNTNDMQTLDRVRSTKGVPIEFLHPSPYQPRRVFDDDALDDLAASIREKGVLQPILVRRLGDDPSAYEIVAGERRWRASQRAGLHEVPVVIKELNDSEALEIALIENIQRADLNPIEEAQGYARLMEKFGHTQDALAGLVGKSRSHVANMLRILNLPAPVRDMVADGRLTPGHARALVTVEDPLAMANEIIEKGLNVRAVEEATKRIRQKITAPKAPPKKKDADTVALEADVSAALGLPVKIDHRGPKGGTVLISYGTLDDLDEICRRLCAVAQLKHRELIEDDFGRTDLGEE